MRHFSNDIFNWKFLSHKQTKFKQSPIIKGNKTHKYSRKVSFKFINKNNNNTLNTDENIVVTLKRNRELSILQTRLAKSCGGALAWHNKSCLTNYPTSKNG